MVWCASTVYRVCLLFLSFVCASVCGWWWWVLSSCQNECAAFMVGVRVLKDFKEFPLVVEKIPLSASDRVSVLSNFVTCNKKSVTKSTRCDCFDVRQKLPRHWEEKLLLIVRARVNKWQTTSIYTRAVIRAETIIELEKKLFKNKNSPDNITNLYTKSEHFF